MTKNSVLSNWTKFQWNFAKPWSVLIGVLVGSRCNKCKKYNKLDPKNSPKNFGTFWTLFTTIFDPSIFLPFHCFFFDFFFWPNPHIKGAKKGVKRVKKVPKFCGVFFGSNLLYFLHFLHLEPNSIKKAQGFAKFGPIWHSKNF